MKEQKGPIYQGAVNHFMGAEGVGGKLFLFPDQLVFKSHSLNIQNHTSIIDLQEIKSIQLRKTLGIVPNGLEILLQDGSLEKFVVNRRKMWLQNIEEARKQHHF